MMERAFYDGIQPVHSAGRLREYLGALCDVEGGSVARVYGEHVYIFLKNQVDETALVTLYQLPFELRRLCRKSTRRWWQENLVRPSTSR